MVKVAKKIWSKKDLGNLAVSYEKFLKPNNA